MIADIALILSMAAVGLSAAALWRARARKFFPLRLQDVEFTAQAFDIVPPGFAPLAEMRPHDQVISTLNVADASSELRHASSRKVPEDGEH